jgi:hypothetical protein
MKKNDKIIVVLGVVMLILASIGIYYYEPIRIVEDITIGEFEDITGVLKNIPEAIAVSDCNPFYPLIATPVAVNYDTEGEQNLIPLFVENMESPSNTIVRIKESLYLFSQEKVDGSKSAKEVSLEFAEKFWESSDAALVIEYNQAGYELGVIATPIASYLSIPVIVTDEIDGEVSRVFSKLGVKKTIICGENLEPIGNYLKLETVEEAVDATIKVINGRFIETRRDRIDYLTLTNPIDAFPSEVLNSTEYHFGPDIVGSSTMIRESTLAYFLKQPKITWEFTIPHDYKYALIEFEGYNHELDGVDEFADHADFSIIRVDDKDNAIWRFSTTNGIAKKDRAGNIIEDKVYVEQVFYDCGGDTIQITAGGAWALLDKGSVSARVTVKKLDNPVYEMMGGLSSIAPYLTAYYKGIVFGKPDFAFTADDHVITDQGTTSPGYYLQGRNIDLVPLANKHVIDNIHEPLNQLLAKLADLPYGHTVDLEPLTNHYKDNPIHIALVGGATVLPRYTYENEVGPIGYTGFQAFGGGGTPTDNIYGNIDPVKYDYSNIANDIHSTTGFPYIENIVGRITGLDVQDANALVLRSLFYEQILEDRSEWKNNFGTLYGGGVDFRAPLYVQIINNIPIIKQLLHFINAASGTMINWAVPPWKMDTGFSIITSKAIEYKIGEKLGFTNIQTALHEEALLDGFSDESLSKLKTASLWNRLTYSEAQIREVAGLGNVKGRDIIENSNFVFLCGHGSIYNLGLEGTDLVASGASFAGLRLWQRFYKYFILPHFVIGFWGPGAGHAKIGEYYPRQTATLEIGPSFIWLESCFVGKITGVTPQANIAQVILHAGPASMIAATCGSNIAGGYLPGKPHLRDNIIGNYLRQREWERKAEQDIYPDLHLGAKIYEDMCNHLTQDKTIGEAFRDAKNQYLPEDADWELWWSPPLSSMNTDAPEPALGWGTHIGPKYSSFNMYQLYGDPAFKPYIPINN